MDNASANDVLARTVALIILKRYGLHIHVDNSRIRCMPHVVNIIVQKMLSLLDEAEDPDLVDYFTLDKAAPIHYDPATDPEQVKMREDASSEDDALSKSDAAMKKRADTEASGGDGAQREALLEVIAALQAKKETENSPVKRVRTRSRFSNLS